jgi:hypothetical protein
VSNRIHFALRLASTIGWAYVIAAQSAHVTAFTGTWKLNVAKSKFDPGPPFQSFTLTFTPDGARNLDLVAANGQPLKATLPWSDGREIVVHIVEGSMQNVTAVSKIKGRTFEDTWRQNGEIIEKVHGAVSPDGRTLAVTVDRPIKKGGTFRNRVVFDKQ